MASGSVRASIMMVSVMARCDGECDGEVTIRSVRASVHLGRASTVLSSFAIWSRYNLATGSLCSLRILLSHVHEHGVGRARINFVGARKNEIAWGAQDKDFVGARTFNFDWGAHDKNFVGGTHV